MLMKLDIYECTKFWLWKKDEINESSELNISNNEIKAVTNVNYAIDA